LKKRMRFLRSTNSKSKIKTPQLMPEKTPSPKSMTTNITKGSSNSVSCSDTANGYLLEPNAIQKIIKAPKWTAGEIELKVVTRVNDHRPK
jgi:hypothetical protein